jgi:hypothetical protein
MSICYPLRVTGLAMLFKPFIALAVFALVVIPLRLLILRASPPAVRAHLSRPVSPVAMWSTWALVMAIVLSYSLLAAG